MKKLWKVVEAIQELLQGTSAKVTLEWGDGTKVVITKHVIGARRPEKPKMEPVDSAALYNVSIPWFPSESGYDFMNEKITYYHGDGSTSTATLGGILNEKEWAWNKLKLDHEGRLPGEPVDTAELHNPTEIMPEEDTTGASWKASIKEWKTNRDKIQGDANNPWTVNDDGSPTT